MKKVKQKQTSKKQKKIVVITPFHPNRLKKINKYRTNTIKQANQKLQSQLTFHNQETHQHKQDKEHEQQ